MSLRASVTLVYIGVFMLGFGVAWVVWALVTQGHPLFPVLNAVAGVIITGFGYLQVRRARTRSGPTEDH